MNLRSWDAAVLLQGDLILLVAWSNQGLGHVDVCYSVSCFQLFNGSFSDDAIFYDVLHIIFKIHVISKFLVESEVSFVSMLFLSAKYIFIIHILKLLSNW